MTTRPIVSAALVMVTAVLLVDAIAVDVATAQTGTTKAPGAPAARAAAPRQATGAASSTSAVAAADAAKKDKILKSEAWRQAMFRINEWLGTQRAYDAKQVAKIKADFSARVAKMPADEMQFVLDDLNEKFKILDTKDAEDARAWLAHYLSILSDKKRTEVLNRIPNLVSMTAPQLRQLIAQIDEKRSAMSQQQAQVQQLRSGATNPWSQPYNAAQQAYVRDHAAGQGGGYSSPYRAPSGELPFANVKTGPNLEFYSGSFGQFGVAFGN